MTWVILTSSNSSTSLRQLVSTCRTTWLTTGRHLTSSMCSWSQQLRKIMQVGHRSTWRSSHSMFWSIWESRTHRWPSTASLSCQSSRLTTSCRLPKSMMLSLAKRSRWQCRKAFKKEMLAQERAQEEAWVVQEVWHRVSNLAQKHQGTSRKLSKVSSKFSMCSRGRFLAHRESATKCRLTRRWQIKK